MRAFLFPGSVDLDKPQDIIPLSTGEFRSLSSGGAVLPSAARHTARAGWGVYCPNQPGTAGTSPPGDMSVCVWSGEKESSVRSKWWQRRRGCEKGLIHKGLGIFVFTFSSLYIFSSNLLAKSIWTQKYFRHCRLDINCVLLGSNFPSDVKPQQFAPIQTQSAFQFNL